MAGIDIYTKSLLHFDNNLTDAMGKTWTNNSTSFSSAVKKFGTHALDLSGSVWIDTPDSDDWTVGSGDFTVDFWIYPDTTNINGFICAQCKNDGAANTIAWAVRYNGSTNQLRFQINSGSTIYDATASSAYSANSWQHAAAVRDGNTLRLFVGGTSVATADVTGVTANNSAYKLTIGRLGEYVSLYSRGYIDEFRFSKGIARWTSNFTPPAKAYSLPGGNRVYTTMLMSEKWNSLWDGWQIGKGGLIAPVSGLVII